MPKVNLVALAKLFVGLYLFGWGVALMVHAAIGLGPWDIFAQGFSKVLHISYGLASIIVSGRPPQRSVGTGARPAKPPAISPKKAAQTSIQAGSSQRFQQRRRPLATTSASSSTLASTGRQCSGAG